MYCTSKAKKGAALDGRRFQGTERRRKQHPEGPAEQARLGVQGASTHSVDLSSTLDSRVGKCRWPWVTRRRDGSSEASRPAVGRRSDRHLPGDGVNPPGVADRVALEGRRSACHIEDRHRRRWAQINPHFSTSSNWREPSCYSC